MEPEMIMENLMKELDAALKAMSRAKTADEKLTYSNVVKNLSDSLGVFLNMANSFMEDDPDGIDQDD